MMFIRIMTKDGTKMRLRGNGITHSTISRVKRAIMRASKNNFCNTLISCHKLLLNRRYSFFLVTKHKNIIFRELEEEVESFRESLESGKDDSSSVLGVLKIGLEVGMAGLQLTSSALKAASQVPLKGILAFLRHTYPGFDDFLNAAKKVKQRVKVPSQSSTCAMLHFYLDNALQLNLRNFPVFS